MTNPRDLVSTLRGARLRCRTGVLLMPSSALGAESEIAAALGVEFLDYGKRLLSMAAPESGFIHLTLDRLVCDLDDIANDQAGEACVLLANFDLAIAQLGIAETKTLWQNLLSDFPNKTRALVVCVPAHRDAHFAFPDSTIRQLWQDSGRFAVWQAGQGGESRL